MGEGSATGRPRRVRAVAWAFLAAVAVAGTAADLLLVYPGAAGPGEGAIARVEVPRGVGPSGLARLLEEAGVVSSPGRFRLWLRVSGRLPEVRAGRFELRDDMSPREVIDALSGPGADRGTRVTVPEGFTLRRVAEAIEEAGAVSKEGFLDAATDRRLLDELGVPGPTAEGFLFPDTYFLERETGAGEVVARMHRAFLERWSSLDPPADADPMRVVTLASIVQAEARLAQEMPTIAGVYANRLESPSFPSRLLQADPTVAYGCEPVVAPRAPSCEGFASEIGRRQLDDPVNPYNTYRHPGLPPGPICAPGIDALAAALRPARVPYLYFVLGAPDGRHVFSVTLEEHRRAVARYREGL